MNNTDFDVVVVGGGPSGATAANDLSMRGFRVLLIERAFRIKPCGGAIPPCLMQEFDIPQHLLVAQIASARMISPTGNTVDMPIDNTFVGMVDRDVFDPWLRQRAASHGALLRVGRFTQLSYRDDGTLRVTYVAKDAAQTVTTVSTRLVIGADGARSKVASQAIPCSADLRWVMAYHEIVDAEAANSSHYDEQRCDVFYQGNLSPDFYAWVFPHGKTASIGVGSEAKDFSAPKAVEALRQQTGLDALPTIRKEGAPIPMKPLKRWEDGRGVLLAGDAAGVVAPASGEGIYYAMLTGRLAADAAAEFLATDDPAKLKLARRRFQKLHGRTFWALGLLQRFWYSSDKRREKFVTMCKDRDVQELTWQAYTQKKLVRKRKAAHMRVLLKDLAQLMGFARA